jgi:signal recognition particle subunit SEC65
MPRMTNTPPLHEIEEAAEALGMKASTLCVKAVNNPHLPARLRCGGSVTVATMEKIRAFVAAEQQRAGAA